MRNWPDGFCDEVFCYGGWIRKPGVAICSCSDGLRPVIMKPKAAAEEPKIDFASVC
ncbi:hypothetical protein [Lientehia hominis]|uniref:hypothetical protein n=1 Tax=Lientehia hominis TaxID=2897778 RepID=UPI002ED87477